jgi:hypothetical protein
MRPVGLALGPGGRSGVTAPRRVYEAIAPQACAACRRPIAVGDRFTRHKRADGGVASVCRTCAPFDEA